MRVAAWLVVAGALMVLVHWWLPAYALASIAALEALVAHERGPARRAERRRAARKGFIRGR